MAPTIVAAFPQMGLIRDGLPAYTYINNSAFEMNVTTNENGRDVEWRNNTKSNLFMNQVGYGFHNHQSLIETLYIVTLYMELKKNIVEIVKTNLCEVCFKKC